MQAAVSQDSDLNFNRLYKTHGAMVRKVVRQFNFRDAAADDLVQDIFLLAWKKRSYLRDLEALSGWLKTIAYNQCVNQSRAQSRQRQRFVSLECYDHEIESPESRTLFDVSLSQFEKHMDVLEDLIRCHKHEARREIAKLFYLEHKTIQEIVETLAMNQNTVLSHLRRFRLIVTQAMHQWMVENS